MARTAAVAGTASVVSGRVHRRQNEKWAAQDQQAYEDQQAAAAPAPAPAAPAGDDLVSQIERLGELKEEGLLTDEEFAAQKAKLLG